MIRSAAHVVAMKESLFRNMAVLVIIVVTLFIGGFLILRFKQEDQKADKKGLPMKKK